MIKKTKGGGIIKKISQKSANIKNFQKKCKSPNILKNQKNFLGVCSKKVQIFKYLDNNKKKGEGVDNQKISQKIANLNYGKKSANLQIFENYRIWSTSK